MKMFPIKKMLFLFLFFIGIFAFSQEKLYFDADWEPTTKDKMEYYRETSKSGNLTHIKDFYKNGTLQMEGEASDPTPNSEVFEGKVTYYYPSGKKQTETEFKNGQPIGIARDYDEEGRILRDFVYQKHGNYSGVAHSYKMDDEDLNSYFEYKNSESVKTIVYDKDMKGIRYEIHYNKNNEESETKYFGEGGKLLGNRVYKNDKYTGITVEYYKNPMRIANISKYGNGYNYDESTQFYENGKMAFEEKYTQNSGTKKSYDLSGKSVGEITFKKSDYEEMIPWNGVDTYFSHSTQTIITATTYKDGKITHSKEFYADGKLKSETFYENDYEAKSNYYNQDGSLKGALTNNEYGEPFNGKFYSDNTESIYKNGILLEEKNFTNDRKLRYEKKLIEAQKIHDVKVYEDGIMTYNYKTKINLDPYTAIEAASDISDDYYFTAEVTQFEKGKEKNKASFKNGILEKGKIEVKTYNGYTEYERKGEWVITREFDENKTLNKETKEKVTENMYVIFTEENLLYQEN